MKVEAQKKREKAFLALAERLRAASSPKKVKQLGEEMGRFVFGQCCRERPAVERGF
jgi:predicted NAD-dependent protein-ADP-ribosyltransferase YbiA (DUF1768 family)